MVADTDERRLEAIFDRSPDAILVVDDRGQIVRANDRAEDLFGYRCEDLEGEDVERLVPEAERDRHPALRESYFDDPEPRPMGVGLDLRAQRQDGSTFPVDIGLGPLETDDGVEVIAAVRDVTEQEELRRKYRTLVQTAPDAMFIADTESGEILEVNRQATELVGRSAEDLVGRPHTILHPAEDADRYRSLFRRHVEAEQAIDARFDDGDGVFVETADGERVPVEISVQTVELRDGDALFALFRDVSERRKYEAELRRQIDRLETLSHVISHDLRNPLNVAEGYVDYVAETGDTDRLADVRDAHARIEELVDDVLTMIRGGYEIESVEPLEFEALLTDCWASVTTGDATLDVLQDGLIYADGKRIRNLFENLFWNSVEHGSTGSRPAADDSVEHGGSDVSIRAGVYEGGFFVADDGPGIPAADRREVFEAGWSTAGSTGLGLSIVSDIVDAHDWRISVSDSEAGGARFDVTGVETAVYDDVYRSS